MTAIYAYGGYVPRLRLTRKAIVAQNAWHNGTLKAHGKGVRAICNWDEDSITMAVAAARDALGSMDRSSLTAVVLGSTSLPFQDRQNAGIVAEALSLSSSATTLDITGSQKAGTGALIAAAGLAHAGPVLLIGSEHRRAKPGSELELLAGDAAAAFVLAPEGTLPGAPVATIAAQASFSSDFVDHYRGRDESYDYGWEARWIRDEGYLKIAPQAITKALGKAGLDGAAIDAFCMPATARGVQPKIAKMCGIAAEAVRNTLDGVLGEAGAAHSLVMLVHALQDAKPGQTILLVGWGQGADVLILKTGEGLTAMTDRLGITGHLARAKEVDTYSKFLTFNDNIEIEKGIRAEADQQTALTSLYRHKAEILGLEGGQCTKCGTRQFPKSRICVNPNCHAWDTQEPYSFADVPAKVMSYTADLLAYSPDPPTHYGMVVFDEGGRMMVDFADADLGHVVVGMPMQMVFRIKARDKRRGFTRYFWKAKPMVEASASAAAAE